MPEAGKTGCKVNMVNMKVSRANAQSRLSGILIAHAIGKLCFALLTSFPAAQNHLPFCKGGMPPKSCIRWKISGKKGLQRQGKKLAGFCGKGGGLF
jgi:hypothetical protein